MRTRSGHEVTVEDVRQLMGASTPHFALQLRARIAKLIAPLPPGTRRGLKASARSRVWSDWASRARRAARGCTARSGPCRRSAAPDDPQLTGIEKARAQELEEEVQEREVEGQQDDAEENGGFGEERGGADHEGVKG